MNAPQHYFRQGFTVVELMLAMLAGAILALTAGIVLMDGFRVLTRNTAAATIQRDGTIAIEMLQRRLREASFSDVYVDWNADPFPELQVTQAGGGTVTFGATEDGAGTNLVFRSGGNTTVIAAHSLRDFAVQDLTTTGIRLFLSLAGDVRPGGGQTEEVDFDATIHFRN